MRWWKISNSYIKPKREHRTQSINKSHSKIKLILPKNQKHQMCFKPRKRKPPKYHKARLAIPSRAYLKQMQQQKSKQSSHKIKTFYFNPPINPFIKPQSAPRNKTLLSKIARPLASTCKMSSTAVAAIATDHPSYFQELLKLLPLPMPPISLLPFPIYFQIALPSNRPFRLEKD